jgi:tetratricopeptide (TPR) repeat protein
MRLAFLTLLLVILEGCATSRYIDGRNAGLLYTNGFPSLLFVEGESGERQKVDLGMSTRIKEGGCPLVKTSAPPELQGRAPVDSVLLKAIERGGGRVCALLVKKDGAWIANTVNFSPTPEQKAALKHAYAESEKEEQEQQELSVEERAQAEAIRQAEVNAWRKRRHKPALPEQVRRDGILAETAISERRIDDAIKLYEDGLQVERLWPEGHRRIAELYGDRREYEKAIEHLRWYLALMPDADDAQAARDKLALWQQQNPKPTDATP